MLFRITIDNDVFKVRLYQRLFAMSTYNELPIYHDLKEEVELKVLPDELKVSGVFENLVRLAKAKNDIELSLRTMAGTGAYGGPKNKAEYSAVLVICRKCEIMYNTYSPEWFPFNAQRIRSTEEQLYDREVAIETFKSTK